MEAFFDLALRRQHRIDCTYMPQPKVWKSKDELVADLRTYWNGHADEAADGDFDWHSAIRAAVGGNTFRAFRKLPHQPSKVFRDWAYDSLVTRGHFAALSDIRSQSDYDEWLIGIVKDLRKTWKRRMAAPMPFGPSYKLPSLLMKGLFRRLPPAKSKRWARFLHVALDSYTLAGVRNFVTLDDGRMIPKRASMGYVKTKPDYLAVQKGIRSLAKLAGVPPIAYDFLAWNVSH